MHYQIRLCFKGTLVVKEDQLSISGDSTECCKEGVLGTLPRRNVVKKGCWEHCHIQNVGCLLTMCPELHDFLGVLYFVV